jgi:hypothetical protein
MRETTSARSTASRSAAKPITKRERVIPWAMRSSSAMGRKRATRTDAPGLGRR